MESSFASAVVYVSDRTEFAPGTVASLANTLARTYSSYEVVIVDDGCSGSTVDATLAELTGHPCSIVRMGIPQGVEPSMNAGVDAAIGDYVYEVDDIGALDEGFVEDARAAVAKGFDIVNGIPISGTSGRGRLFYRVFNHFSGFPTKIASNPCRLVSRRAINRVRSMSSYSPYRKASYAASGLRIAEVPTCGRPARQTDADMAVTSLALYTSAFYRVAMFLAIAMALVSLAELVYVVVIALSGIAVTGWITTMFVLTVGFMAVFVLLAFTLKYLDLLVRITFERQGYLTEGIEKPDDTNRKKAPNAASAAGPGAVDEVIR